MRRHEKLESKRIPENIDYVIFYVSGYKANVGEVTINGVTTTLETFSNDGVYTAIVVDTTTNKTVSFTTTENGKRVLIDSIVFAE